MARIHLFFVLLLYLSKESFAAVNKVPIPEGSRIIPLGPEHCNKIPKKTPVSTADGCANGTESSKSPCKRECMYPHKPIYGHRCDPFLFRFARRQYDDQRESLKKWMSDLILGRPVQILDSDFWYKGNCGFMCPAMMCMEVIQHEDPLVRQQWVDMAKFDCLHDKVIDRYSGVCTCGHQWSLVDPANSHRTLVNDSSSLNENMVTYHRTIGLDRRLVYDNVTNDCAAERYGHCSVGMNWPKELENVTTPCLTGKQLKCVNRTADYLGTAYRNFRTKRVDTPWYKGKEGEGYWYGICDSEFEINDPFANAPRIGTSLTFTITFTAVFQKVMSLLFTS